MPGRDGGAGGGAHERDMHPFHDADRKAVVGVGVDRESHAYSTRQFVHPDFAVRRTGRISGIGCEFLPIRRDPHVEIVSHFTCDA